MILVLVDRDVRSDLATLDLMLFGLIARPFGLDLALIAHYFSLRACTFCDRISLFGLRPCEF